MKALTVLLVDRGDIAEAGRCMARVAPARIFGTFHDRAPVGVSVCAVCDRVVVRGMGRWWQR